MKKRQNASQGTKKQFTRLLPLAGLVTAVFTLTAASPTGRRPIGVTLTPTLGNYPTTSIVLSANTTVTPDAAPTNATSMNISTSTNFKGKLEGNPTTGVVRVTDTHPAGTYAITVRAFGSNGDSTTATFNLTVTTPETCLPVSFAPAAHYETFGLNPAWMAVGDFDGDGKQDLAMTRQPFFYISYLFISFGDGAGHFGRSYEIPFPGSIGGVVVGDLNGDGKQDLAIADGPPNSPDNLSILLGDGAGHFGAPTAFGADSIYAPVAVGDFNGDGRQDLVAMGLSNVLVFLGDGAGSLGAPINVGAGSYPTSVAVGDFNGDGKQDLAVCNGASNNVSILLGDGTGHFAQAMNLAVGTYPYSVALGDFNNDGNQDLAIINYLSHNVSILLGDGGGHFTGMTLPIGSGNDMPYRLAVGDFNGDGQQDLAIADYHGFASIFTGDGTGYFGLATKLSSGGYVVAVGDFNGDGKQDLATAGDDDLSIFLRDCATDQCTVCHKHTTTITLPCDSMEYRRHLDHGDSVGACPSGAGRKD